MTTAAAPTATTRALDLRPGQRITEVDTPEGPFYEVARVNRASVVLYLDADDHAAGTVRIPVTDTDVVIALPA